MRLFIIVIVNVVKFHQTNNAGRFDPCIGFLVHTLKDYFKYFVLASECINDSKFSMDIKEFRFCVGHEIKISLARLFSVSLKWNSCRFSLPFFLCHFFRSAVRVPYICPIRKWGGKRHCVRPAFRVHILSVSCFRLFLFFIIESPHLICFVHVLIENNVSRIRRMCGIRIQNK